VPKEDYLLKYLEKLSRVIAAMFGFRDKGYPEEAIRLADETYKELLDFNIDELAIMSIDEFVEMVQKKRYSSTYLEALAKLAHETANSFQLLDNKIFARVYFTKALHLYYLLNEKDKTFSFERETMISELLQLTK
jgi:hypothetical protein